MPTGDVVVIGAGLIGAAVAWRCARDGRAVTVVDPDPTRGAWHTAAGMLAPATEAHATEAALLRLNLDSARRWPAFAAELEDDAGASIGLRTDGTVHAAWDAADLAELQRRAEVARALGAAVEPVTGRELRALEPALAPGRPGGLFAPGDHQVDPRRLHAALTEAGRRHGVRLVTGTATPSVVGGRVQGARIEGGGDIAAPVVVVAAGAWSGGVLGVPVRPVKGTTLRLRLPGPPRLSHVVRADVRGTPIYLVPRADGEIVAGASSEEAGFDVTARAGVVYELLRDAQTLVPELAEATLAEISTGLRPGSRDNAPVIGATAVDGLLVATGHHRNGVLLAPVTADAVAALVRGEADAAVAPFGPDRFAAVPT